MASFNRSKMESRRKKLGLSKSAFAREAGLHPSTVSQIELGRLNPYPAQLEKIEAAFARLEGKEE